MTLMTEQTTVLSVAAPIFVPSAPAPVMFFRSDPAKASVTQIKVKKQGRRGAARAQENATAAPDFRSSSIKKPKSPPVRAPTHNNAAPLVRLSGVKLVRSKSDRDRLLQVAQEIVESQVAQDEGMPPPPQPAATPATPSTSNDLLTEDFLKLSGVPLTRSAASELAIIMGNDCSLGF